MWRRNKKANTHDTHMHTRNMNGINQKMMRKKIVIALNKRQIIWHMKRGQRARFQESHEIVANKTDPMDTKGKKNSKWHAQRVSVNVLAMLTLSCTHAKIYIRSLFCISCGFEHASCLGSSNLPIKLNVLEVKIIIAQFRYCCEWRCRHRHRRCHCQWFLCRQLTIIPIKWCHSPYNSVYEYRAAPQLMLGIVVEHYDFRFRNGLNSSFSNVKIAPTINHIQLKRLFAFGVARVALLFTLFLFSIRNSFHVAQ